jgi:hypothetical protein
VAWIADSVTCGDVVYEHAIVRWSPGWVVVWQGRSAG